MVWTQAEEKTVLRELQRKCLMKLLVDVAYHSFHLHRSVSNGGNSLAHFAHPTQKRHDLSSVTKYGSQRSFGLLGPLAMKTCYMIDIDWFLTVFPLEMYLCALNKLSFHFSDLVMLLRFLCANKKLLVKGYMSQYIISVYISPVYIS